MPVAEGNICNTSSMSICAQCNRNVNACTDHPDPKLLYYRSVVEGSTRNTSSMSIAMLAGKGKSSSPGAIYASIPYIKAEVPIFILFRALGFIVSHWIPESHVPDGFANGPVLIMVMGSLSVGHVAACVISVQISSMYFCDNVEFPIVTIRSGYITTVLCGTRVGMTGVAFVSRCVWAWEPCLKKPRILCTWFG